MKQRVGRSKSSNNFFRLLMILLPRFISTRVCVHRKFNKLSKIFWGKKKRRREIYIIDSLKERNGATEFNLDSSIEFYAINHRHLLRAQFLSRRYA